MPDDDPKNEPGTGDPDPKAEPGTGDSDGGKNDPKVDHEAEATKWKALARKHEQQAKSNADAAKRLKEIEDEKKSTEQKLADELAEAKSTGQKASAELLRLQVALDKAPEGMPLAQVRKLAGRLQGGTQEEIEADADELFADFTGTTSSDTDGEDGKKPPPRKPTETLKGSTTTDPDAGGDLDTKDVLERVPRL